MGAQERTALQVVSRYKLSVQREAQVVHTHPLRPSKRYLERLKREKRRREKRTNDLLARTYGEGVAACGWQGLNLQLPEAKYIADMWVEVSGRQYKVTPKNKKL